MLILSLNFSLTITWPVTAQTAVVTAVVPPGWLASKWYNAEQSFLPWDSIHCWTSQGQNNIFVIRPCSLCNGRTVWNCGSDINIITLMMMMIIIIINFTPLSCYFHLLSIIMLQYFNLLWVHSPHVVGISIEEASSVHLREKAQEMQQLPFLINFNSPAPRK